MKSTGRGRCVLVCLFFTLLFSLFSWRLIYLQVVKHDYYSEKAAEKNVGRNVIPAERERFTMPATKSSPRTFPSRPWSRTRL